MNPVDERYACDAWSYFDKCTPQTTSDFVAHTTTTLLHAVAVYVFVEKVVLGPTNDLHHAPSAFTSSFTDSIVVFGTFLKFTLNE